MPTAAEADRGGETALPFDPGRRAATGLAFIGRIRSPWSPGDCPHSLTEARSLGRPAAIEIDRPYRAGLAGLAAGDALIVLSFLDRARRDLIALQPPHRDRPAGSFALRAPARPNPIGLSVTRITAIDAATGLIAIEAIDLFDGTPVVDLKPWIGAIDTPPDPPHTAGLASGGASG